MRSGKVLELLQRRHSDDVFVSECKTGPTQTGTHQRFDAWAMKKSWVNGVMTGYEIKVSRSDFLQDEKWPGYLPFCHQFYFVCPHGVIDPGEVGDECGLLWVAKSGTRLYSKKKAPRRVIDTPINLLIYILMARAGIDERERWGERPKDFWRAWLEGRRSDQSLGHQVGKKLAATIRQQIQDANEENRRLTNRIETYNEIRGMLKELGLSSGYVSTFNLKRQLEEIANGIPNTLLQGIDDAQRCLAQIKESLNGEERSV